MIKFKIMKKTVAYTVTHIPDDYGSDDSMIINISLPVSQYGPI